MPITVNGMSAFNTCTLIASNFLPGYLSVSMVCMFFAIYISNPWCAVDDTSS